MVKLTKLSNKDVVINSDQIQYIESIPESKIVMMNGEYVLVRDSTDEIIDKIVEFRQKCNSGDTRELKELLLASLAIRENNSCEEER